VRRAAAIAAFAAGLVAAVHLSAHDAAKAIVVLRPGEPHVGQACAVSVSVLAPPGVPFVDQIQGVSILGEMTGHAMTPVEAPLASGERSGIYDGSFALTMAGPWKMTLRINVMNEVMWAEFPVAARRAVDPPDTDGLRYVLELRDPVRASVFPPWAVVAVSLGLVGLIEALAVLFKRRREALARPAI
jgi:hypothetical protein